MNEARCGRCKTTKPLPEFPPSKERNSGQWCRKCYREWMRERKGLTAHEHAVECAWCGGAFETTYTKARFCSFACKDRARKQAMKEVRITSKPDRNCVWCGVPLPRTMRADARYCSETCNDAAHKQTRNYQRRSGKGRWPGMGKVNFAHIASRDHWRCGICGGQVSPERRWPDVLAGSLDHIVPVSRGGGNEDGNLRLAHLRCNASRRAG